LKFFIFLVFLIPNLLLAQTADSIRSGRPGQSIGPFVVGTGYLQFQSGIDSNWLNGPLDESSYLLNNVLRLGLSEDFEISGVINWQDETLVFNKQRGISSIQLGFRYNIISKSQGWIPSLGLQTRFQTNFVDSEYRAKNLAPIMILATGHNLTDSLGLNLNLGLKADGDTPILKYFYTTNFNYSLTDQWGTFLEFYGNERAGVRKNFIDTGLSYKANKDLQWDFSTGWGRNQDKDEYFVSLGISYRMLILNRLY
jgi:hypothetical protein